MSKTLVIAEKPSVAQDIVRALTPTAGKFEKKDEYFEADDWLVTSAVGHLVEIKAPEEFDVKRGKWSFANLPVIPPHFDLNPIDKSKGRLNAIVKLAKRKDVGALVNACDAGREGELIFRLIQDYAKARQPVRRLWLQSMTPQAIREGFETLRSDEQMRPLADAARCRSEADWLVGINGTRAMTAFNSRDGGFFLTTVGRVQTPTLSVVVEREERIRKFKARDYWEVHATFAAEAGLYSGRWFDPAFKKSEDEHAKPERVWAEREAQAIADAVRGKTASVEDESKPTTQSSPLLFDLTSLQREANSKFGFSAKTTLSIAQALYEKHKVLTYPRTDSKALPEDYVGVVKKTLEALADDGPKHLGVHARKALAEGYVKPTKRVFDNAKVSDHFAIIPTTQAPRGLSDIEQKLYDLVARRFMAVFYPPAEFLVTTRITRVAHAGKTHAFRSDGKVLVKPGWLAIYGKDVAAEGEDGSDKLLTAVKPGELVRTDDVTVKALKTKPPARYTEATLLGAMEGAGKLVEDDEFRDAMGDKGLGTPATRAAIIEGLLLEKYLLRDGRELVPTAKAFQLMTLLRGLGVDELTKPELTGEWEHQLALMERGKLSREAFMAGIQKMTEHIVAQAKGYDRDTVPGDYATLEAPCPNCGGVVQENYRRFACSGGGASGRQAGNSCGFSIGKIPGGRAFELHEVEAFLRDKHIGPLDGFRSKAGWPFVAELKLVRDPEAKDQGFWKLEFDFGDSDNPAETGELVSFEGQQSLGACPKCGSGVFEQGKSYVCEKSVPTAAQALPSCDFKSGQIILQQPIVREQMAKLLATGKTDVMDKFVSNRTRRAFKAFLTWSADEGKVIFGFEPRLGKDGQPLPERPRRVPAKTAAKTVAKAPTKAAAKKAPAKKAAARKTATKAPAAKRAGGSGGGFGSGMTPSPALAAVIGAAPVTRAEATKKLWDYIKAQGLQDAANKRNINADAKLAPVFAKPQVTMFELARVLAVHLSKA